jgi:hypothetical protein
MKALLLVLATWLVDATLAGAQAGQPARLAAASIDSIVLERTICYGPCPAYRLRLDAAGRIHFQSRNPGEEVPAVTDSISPEGVLFLQQEAARIGFFALPAQIDRTNMCRDRATDNPTATVTIFTVAGVHAVRDYHGCFNGADHSVMLPLANLRTFEAQIDGVAGSFRWSRPNRRH